MTHAECQDLLLDLAYGELDATRAAEAELHVAACADCRRQRAEMVATRKVAAPLRELEEPSASFDERILAAARAEASLQSDGKPGPVIEVTGSVRPLGLEPARIDAHARVSSAPDRRRPRWAMRVALGGSVAAAAALAVMVSTSRRPAERRLDAEGYAIHVQTAAERARTEARQEAHKAAQLDEVQKPQSQAPSPPALEPAPAAQPASVAQPAPFAQLAKEKKATPKLARAPREIDAIVDAETGGGAADKTAGVKGAGGDAPGRAAPHDAKELAAPKPAASVAMSPPPSAPATPTSGPAATPMHGVVSVPAMVSEGKDAKGPRDLAVARQAAVPQMPAKPQAAVEELTPQHYEQKAQEARRAGNYVLAASLYRRAAGLRGADDATAAWDLAHTVECLAAAGYGNEALQVRDQLKASYPSETSAINAAQRSLIHIEVAPAAAAETKMKVKSEPSAAPAETEKSDSKIPSD